jgi:hypothetical protein
MPVVLDPTLNIFKLQLPLANNLQQLPHNHTCQLALSKRYWQRAHLTPNIQLFNFQKTSLKHYYFITVNCPLDKFMNGRDFYPIKEVSRGQATRFNADYTSLYFDAALN